MANMQVKQMLAEDDVLQLQALSLSPSHAAHFIVPSVVCEAEFNQLWYIQTPVLVCHDDTEMQVQFLRTENLANHIQAWI